MEYWNIVEGDYFFEIKTVLCESSYVCKALYQHSNTPILHHSMSQ